MLRAKQFVATVGVLSVLGVGGGSMAVTTGPPTVQRPQADITFTHVAGKVRTCQGEDGAPWTEVVFNATGTSLGDPLLTGEVSARFSVPASNEGGYNQGSLRIREPGTGQWKAHGRFFQSEIAEFDQGILVGEVRNPGSHGSDRLRPFAGMRTVFLPGGTFSSQLGGEVPDARLPATATGGRCTGPFTHFELDLSAPEVVLEPARAVLDRGRLMSSGYP